MLRERRDRIRDPDRAPFYVGMQPFTRFRERAAD